MLFFSLQISNSVSKLKYRSTRTPLNSEKALFNSHNQRSFRDFVQPPFHDGLCRSKGLSWCLNGYSWCLNDYSWCLNDYSWCLNDYSWCLKGFSWHSEGNKWCLIGYRKYLKPNQTAEMPKTAFTAGFRESTNFWNRATFDNYKVVKPYSISITKTTNGISFDSIL